MKNLELRLYVAKMHAFYQDLCVGVAMHVFFVLVWFIQKHSGFWPVWSLFSWILWLGIRSYHLGFFRPKDLQSNIPKIFTQQWEEEKIKELQNNKNLDL
jgi:hypothetical protein